MISNEKIKLSSLHYLFSQNKKPRCIHVLDGWRGLSILFVLSAHLLPLGPSSWELNGTFGVLGMCLFFILSGFLITNFLYKSQNIIDFIIRRFFRILPLAWLYVFIALLLCGVSESKWLAHLFFYANWPPMSLTKVTSHFWSLCVEMQFYLLVALIVLLFRKKGLFILPFLCFLVTWYRFDNNVYVAINTYYRLDEILAGCILSLIYNNSGIFLVKKYTSKINPYFIIILLLASCHPDGDLLNYFRPYLSALLIAITLFNPKLKLSYFLNINILYYLAAVSYALYVIHGGVRHTWLGEGDTLVKYAKRPALFVITFLLAHFSTFYYEKYFMSLGHRLSAKFKSG
mgnify:CR=1 FL=1